MNRKKFLTRLSLGIVGTPLILASCSSDDDDGSAVAEDCKLTSTDDLGPFFVAGTAAVVNLNTQNLPGVPMLMSGKVYSGEGTNTPLAGAKIEIWHADDGGRYHPEGSGDVSGYPANEITLRGFVITDNEGAYSFRSIRPGLYGGRARHIHYKITALNHTELVTQSYFMGDSRIPQDELSRNAGECRIVNYTDDGNGGVNGAMDFNIKSN